MNPIIAEKRDIRSSFSRDVAVQGRVHPSRMNSLLRGGNLTWQERRLAAIRAGGGAPTVLRQDRTTGVNGAAVRQSGSYARRESLAVSSAMAPLASRADIRK
jgi:hypothetical protein